MTRSGRFWACALAVVSLGTGAAHAADATLEIDYSQNLGTQKSMLGMNHGAIPLPDEAELSEPAYDEFIDPLDFQVWSTGSNMTREGFVDMVQASHPDARTFMRVGGGLVHICPYAGVPERPYLDIEDYKSYVRCVARWARDHDVDVLDIWNEPNMADFAGMPNGRLEERDYFYRTFKIAYDEIKAEWPEAVIAGPSLGKTDQEEWLFDFMEFCEENKLEVPIITWHENGTLWNTDWFPDLPAKLLDARAAYIDSGAYPNVGVQEIVINEAIALAYNDIPANNLAVLYYLEQGRADGAARTCWDDDPSSTCFNNTLNGLVTRPEAGPQQKRAMWWLYDHYNRSLEDRAEVTSDLENLVGIANDRVLLTGVYASREFGENNPDASIEVDITLRGLQAVPWIPQGQETLFVRIYEIDFANPYAGVPELPVFFAGDVELDFSPELGRFYTTTLDMDVHHVYVVEFGLSEDLRFPKGSRRN